MIKKRTEKQRKGCDSCKNSKIPTEKFDGWANGTLWICDTCYSKLINWK